MRDNTSPNARRHEHLRKMCQDMSPEEQEPRPVDLSKPKFYERLLADDNDKVLYCVIPKNGCTSWKALMALKSGFFNPFLIQNHPEEVHKPRNMREAGLTFMSNFTIEEIRWRMEKYYKFVIYRHPMERLASAWYNKFVQESWYAEQKYQLIYEKFGRVTDDNVTVVPFTGFLEALTSEEGKTNREIRGFQGDKHWQDQVSMCHPCYIQYDYIAKLETMDVDAQPLLQLFGATELPELNVAKPNGTDSTRWMPRANIKESLAQVSPAVQEGIKVRLQRDMQLLDYTWEEYGLGGIQHDEDVVVSEDTSVQRATSDGIS